MNKTVLLLMITFIALVTSQTAGDEKFRPNIKQKYSKRTLSVKLSAAGDTLTISTQRVGSGGKGEKGKANGLTFVFSSKEIPTFGLQYFTKKQKDLGKRGKPFTSAIGFDRLIYYKEVDGVAGYTEGKDTVLSTYYFSSKKRNGTRRGSWSKIRIIRQQAETGTAKVYRAFTHLKRRTDQAGKIFFGLEVTPEEIIVERNGTSKTKNVLTPNSFKLNANLTGLVFPAGATGFALGAVLRLSGATRKAAAAAKQPAQERGDEATPQQDVLNIASDDDAKANGAFFSWKKFVEAKVKGALVSKGVIASPVTNLTLNTGGFPPRAGKHLKRIWFSVADNTVTEFLWDPTLGAIETTSGTASVVFNVSLLFACVIYFLF